MSNPDKRYFTRHPDDKGVDEILLVAPVPNKMLPTTVEESREHAFLKIELIERYKTSGMSGDEWRFSTGLYLREPHRKDWKLISTGGSLQAHCAQLYPELYGDFLTQKWPGDFFKRKVAAAAFVWKGEPVYSLSYDGKPLPLLQAAGHLGYAWYLSADQGSNPAPLNVLCAQPGCANPHTSVYRLKHTYCHQGHKGDPFKDMFRGFCDDHAERGDCALDDANANYILVEGEGPVGNQPNPDKVNKAKFMGFIGDTEGDV